MSETNSAAAIQERVKEQRAAEGAAPTRPVYRYTVPPHIANGITNVGLVQLTSTEELRATKRANNDSYRLVFELSKQSLVEANGTPVKEGDGSLDAAWGKMNPPTRNLIMTAYAKLHTPEPEDVDAFLESQEVAVG